MSSGVAVSLRADHHFSKTAGLGDPGTQIENFQNGVAASAVGASVTPAGLNNTSITTES